MSFGGGTAVTWCWLEGSVRLGAKEVAHPELMLSGYDDDPADVRCDFHETPPGDVVPVAEASMPL